MSRSSNSQVFHLPPPNLTNPFLSNLPKKLQTQPLSKDAIIDHFIETIKNLEDSSSSGAKEGGKRQKRITNELESGLLEWYYEQGISKPSLEEEQFMGALMKWEVRRVQVWFQNRRKPKKSPTPPATSSSTSNKQAFNPKSSFRQPHNGKSRSSSLVPSKTRPIPRVKVTRSSVSRVGKENSTTFENDGMKIDEDETEDDLDLTSTPPEKQFLPTLIRPKPLATKPANSFSFPDQPYVTTRSRAGATLSPTPESIKLAGGNLNLNHPVPITRLPTLIYQTLSFTRRSPSPLGTPKHASKIDESGLKVYVSGSRSRSRRDSFGENSLVGSRLSSRTSEEGVNASSAEMSVNYHGKRVRDEEGDEKMDFAERKRRKSNSSDEEILSRLSFSSLTKETSDFLQKSILERDSIEKEVALGLLELASGKGL